jgi:hypothetical protein
MTKNYEVYKSNYDASRPYSVVATFRSFNNVIARYSTKEQANRRARDMNNVSMVNNSAKS